MGAVEIFIQQIAATSLWEWFAVLTGILYVILAARKSILCWPFAIISSLIYIYLCYTSQLYIESVLQVFYLVMGVVGWILWNRSQDEHSDIKRWSLNAHLLNIVISAAVVFLVGYSFATFTDQANPYFDAFTTIFSLAATFMVTQKVLENWIYWIAIDLVSIFLYADRGYYLTSVLYFVFTILAIVGYFVWLRKLKLQMS
jgi:nicotinamide mononucleotide transporter